MLFTAEASSASSSVEPVMPAAVVVKLERADELVMVKLLSSLTWNSLPPILCQPGVKSGSLLIERSPLFGAARLIKLMVGKLPQASQYAQCVFGTSGIIRMPSLVLIVNSSA